MGGLKGAVPITLATFPLLMGVPGAEVIFDVVFFVVLLSALTQGISLPYFARRLGLELPATVRPPVSLEITSLKHVDGDIVDFTLSPDSRAVGRTIMELGMPQGVVIAMVARGQEIIPPSGSTVLRAGDHVFVVLRSKLRPAVERIFSPEPESQEMQLAPGEFPLRGSTRLGDLVEFYDLEVEADPDLTIAELFRERVPRADCCAGAELRIGDARIVAHEVTRGGDVELAGLTLESPDGQVVEE